MKEDATKPEKWPFAEPQPIREDQIRNAVNFLSHPKVRGTPVVQRFSFLERKGLTREEIEEAFRRCPDPLTSEATKIIAPSEGKVPAQAQSEGFHQAVVSAQTQPAQQYTSGLIVPARSGSNWSQLILGAGLMAAAGAGTGYFFQKVLAPKLRAWLRDVMLEERKPTDSNKREGQGKGPRLTPLEEAAGAAAAAANAAATAAAEVANTSREVLKMRAEEWQHLRTLIKTLDSKTEELKSTLTSMRKNSQDAQEHVVSAAHAEAEDTSYYRGIAKPYQRTSSPAEQIQMKQGIQAINGVDKTQANGHSSNFSSDISQLEDEPWWRHKKVEMETYGLQKQHMESTLQISEVEATYGKQQMESTPQISEVEVQNRGGLLGRQGWMPPPVPQTVIPGAASAIRYQKLASVDEPKRAAVAEEKEVDSRQPPPLLQTGSLDSSFSIRLQNPVRVDEAKPTLVAEEKEITAQTTLELPKGPSVPEVAEITTFELPQVPEVADVAQTTFELPKVPKVAEVAVITSVDKEISSPVEGDGA